MLHIESTNYYIGDNRQNSVLTKDRVMIRNGIRQRLGNVEYSERAHSRYITSQAMVKRKKACANKLEEGVLV